MLRCPHLQAMQRNPLLKKLVKEKGLTESYLVRACKAKVPGWRISRLRERKAFTPAQKRARLAYCTVAVLYAWARWQSTIFVDEHTFYRKPKALPCINIGGRRVGGRHQSRKVRDKRLKRYPWAYPKLHFMYGVHWHAGVFGPYWISDCAGWLKKDGHRTYPVSRRNPPGPS